MSGPDDFGPYQRIFRHHGYLELLHCQWKSTAVIREVAEIGDEHSFVRLMYADPNWRPHLVACIATLLARDPTELLPSLWEAVDKSSWVIPQLLVTAYFTDPALAYSIVTRAETSSNPKLIASIYGIASGIEALIGWHSDFTTAERRRKLLEEDSRWDKSGVITIEWRTAIVERFAEIGRTLTPRTSS